MANRIITRIEKVEKSIQAKGSSAKQIEESRKKMDMDIEEYCQFQNLKSVAQINGRLTLEEAQSIYGYLGNTVEHFNAQSLAVKYVLTQVFSSLLGDRITGLKEKQVA